jgi:CHAT domain
MSRQPRGERKRGHELAPFADVIKRKHLIVVPSGPLTSIPFNALIRVSHWAVGLDAAVKLTTRAFAELKAHPEIGRAEALRISMKELIEKGDLAEAHPRQWAPFVIVGEGSASR